MEKNLRKLSSKQFTPLLNRLWLVVLYLAGASLWGQFFNWGKIPFDYHDWAEINAARLEYLRDAVIQDVLPLHASETAHLRNITDRVLSVPDFIITPQAILLRWMDVGTFILVNTWLLYSLAFAGLLWFRREYHLSPVIFAALVLLFNFNGYMIGHFSVGHITWWAIFFFPLLFVQIFRFLKGVQSWLWVFETSVIFFAMFLQGGYHQYTWCLIFLGILGIVVWRRFFPILKVLVFANLLAMVRMLPPALLLGKFDTTFIGGYPGLWNIPQAMLIERLPQQALPFQNFYSGLGYWEFDLYSGIIGSAFIGLGMLAWLVNANRQKRFPILIVPMALLALFSFNNIFQLVNWLPVPLLSAERVTSRMIFLPYSLAMVLASGSLQSFINARKRPLPWKIAGLFGMAYLAFDLTRHVLRWQVVETAKAFPVTPINLAIKTLANHPDPSYIAALIIGGIISLAALIALLVLTWREQNRQSEVFALPVQPR